MTGSLSGFIGGGVMAVLGPGGCPGVATTGCDVGVRGRPRETQIRGGGGEPGRAPDTLHTLGKDLRIPLLTA